VWALGAIALAGVAAILVLTHGRADLALAEGQVQALLVALAAGVAIYVVDRERRLRVLTRLLIEERSVTEALSERLDEARILLGVARALNSRLPLDAILDRLVSAAAELTHAERAELLLTADAPVETPTFRVVAATPAATPVGTDVPYDVVPAAAHAARTWDPVAVPGTGVHVPVLHANQLLGVLNVTGRAGDYEQRVAMVFAEQAAFAIAAVHGAEAARWEEAERSAAAGDRASRMLGAATDLKDPLASLVAAARMLQRPKVTDDERLELARVVTRQSHRMAKVLEDVLTVPR